MMTVHGQEAPPKKTHFRYNKVDVWMEFQCFSYLRERFPLPWVRARTQGVTARSRHPDRVDKIAVPDAPRSKVPLVTK